MSAFKRFGISHLSPSSLNCWRDTPGIWCLRYLAQVRDDGTPAMWRGTAVERGLEIILRGGTLKDAQGLAMETFESAAQGEITDAMDAERKLIPNMVARCADWNADRLSLQVSEPLAATQLKIETWLDGVSIPLIGYVDFTFMEGADIDCKSTKACPSTPRADHIRQVALYWKARSRPAGILYVTDKRFAYYCPPEDILRDAVEDLADAGRSLERFLSVMPNADTAVRCMPMPKEHYAWSPAYQENLAQIAEAF